MEILSGSAKQIIKPENDLKEYHFVELPNKVQAFLISNKKHLEHFQLEKERVAPKSSLNPLESKNFSPNPKIRKQILEEIAASINNSPGHSPDDYDENEDEEGEDEIYSDEGESPEMSPDAKDKKNRRGLASVSITICAGSCSEPEEFPGLAHLLEHIICLGSKEFPEEDSYAKFISKHGGFENAFTSLDTTTYEFDIDNEHLGEALYRFSRLLKEPLLKKEGIAKEVKAIDNEFELAAVDEDVQRFQVILSSFRKGHPLRIFPWGNAVSLNQKEEDLEAAVRKFYDSYYKTDAIKMCIYANYSLEELEAMFTKSFDDLEPRLSDPQKAAPSNPVACDIEASRKDLSGCYFLKTTGQVHTITFTWAIETLLWEYQVIPLNLVMALLNERGPGSLYHYLKQENFITDLGADIDDIDGQRNECLFLPYLWIKLTDNGMENLGKVINATGEYLNMLTFTTMPDYYYNEAKAMSKYEFKYADEVSEEDLTNIISQSMKYIPYQNLLESGVYRVHLKEDRELVSKVFSQMLLKHARIDIQAPEITEQLRKIKVNKEVEYEFEEIYFKTKYTALDINGLVDLQIYNKILENGFFSSENFHYPKKNPLIPETLVLQPVDDKFVLPSNIAAEKDIAKQILWYRIDSEFRIPKANIQVLILFHLKKEARINTFLELLEHYLLEQFFQDLGNQARNANFDCAFDKHEYCGLELSVYGFSDNIVTLVQMIIDFLFHTLDHIQEDLLNQIIEKRIKHYEKVLDDPEKYLKTGLIKCMFDYSLMPEEKINLLKSSDFAENFKLFCKTLVKPSSIKNVKTYGHGNITLNDIKDLSVKVKSYVERVSQEAEASETDVFVHKANKLNVGLRKLPEKPLHVRMISHIRKQKNNMALYFMDIGEDTLENRVLCQMLNQIFNTELFESLRMRQQIGYIANSYLLLMPGKRIGMEVWVSSSKLNASGLQAKIKEFVKWFCKDFLQGYSDQDFEELKQSEISIKTRPLQTIQEVALEFWSEIKSGSLMLNRKQEEIKYLTSLEFKKFRNWVRDVIIKSKKVALELESMPEKEEDEAIEEAGEDKGEEQGEAGEEENDDEYEDIEDDEDEGNENNEEEEGDQDFESLFKKNLTKIVSVVEKLDKVWNYVIE